MDFVVRKKNIHREGTLWKILLTRQDILFRIMHAVLTVLTRSRSARDTHRAHHRRLRRRYPHPAPERPSIRHRTALRLRFVKEEKALPGKKQQLTSTFTNLRNHAAQLDGRPERAAEQRGQAHEKRPCRRQWLPHRRHRRDLGASPGASPANLFPDATRIYRLTFRD